jgi:hypothetical protein
MILLESLPTNAKAKFWIYGGPEQPHRLSFIHEEAKTPDAINKRSTFFMT